MDPSKKKLRKPLPIFNVEPHDDAATDLRFTTAHPRKPGEIDLTQFAFGLSSNFGSWGGDFTGRPDLIRQLAPKIRELYGHAPNSVTLQLISSLRTYWRLFDSLEDISPVRTVEDITHIHEAEQFRCGINGVFTNYFLRVMNAYKAEHGQAKLFWKKPEKGHALKVLPRPEHVKAIYEELKHLCWEAIDRLNAADQREGEDWSANTESRTTRKSWTQGELTTTYRGLIALTGHPCPTREMITAVCGGRPMASLRTMEEMRNTYFILEDIQAFFHLFVLLTGWNGGTTLDIDLSLDPVQPHPTNPDLQLVRGIKTRGNTEQVAISQAKRELSPGNIILLVVKRTEALRQFLLKEFEDANSAGDTKRAMRLQREIRSPWLHPLRDGVVKALTPDDAKRWEKQTSFLDYVIGRINKRNEPKGVEPIPLAITPRSLRDAFISFAYERSGYNWLLAKLAAGHKNPASTTTYLRNNYWAAFGNSKIRSLLAAMWGDIESRRIVEPAFLFAMVQRGEISEEQRVRWLSGKDRTRVGVGCKGFYSPPKTIAPQHQPGTGCRVFRCTLCVHAVLFEDSADHMCRRLAELEALQGQVPVVSWEQSSFPEEMRSLELNLKLFSSELVDTLKVKWQLAIAKGAHRIPTTEGAYE